MTKEFLRLRLTQIIPYENNPRINDEAVKDVMESVRQCGELDPIEIDENNVILSGHTRLKAYYKLGYEEADVVRFTGLDEEQKRKYRLLANKTGEKAQWDFDKLKEELEAIDFDGYDFGFEVSELTAEDLEGAEIENNTKKPVAVKIIFKDSQKWRAAENAVRQFVDSLDDVTVSVGNGDED